MGMMSRSMQQVHFPLVLGGDHSLSLGSIRRAITFYMKATKLP